MDAPSTGGPMPGIHGSLGGISSGFNRDRRRFVFLPMFFPLDFKRDKSLMLFNNIAYEHSRPHSLCCLSDDAARIASTIAMLNAVQSQDGSSCRIVRESKV